MIKSMVVVLVLTVLGGIIGMFVAIGIWEAANKGHAPENGAGGLWGFMLGAPVGGIVGFISGMIWAILRRRLPSNKALAPNRGAGY